MSGIKLSPGYNWADLGSVDHISPSGILVKNKSFEIYTCKMNFFYIILLSSYKKQSVCGEKIYILHYFCRSEENLPKFLMHLMEN